MSTPGRRIQSTGRSRHFAPTSAQVRALRSARRARETYFGRRLFAEPAWDILLELYANYLDERRVGILELGNELEIADATLIRWLQQLGERGFVERVLHPTDKRRVSVGLTPAAAGKMHEWFAT
jgi:DNA-binding MarR family transcriptional regulator